MHAASLPFSALIERAIELSAEWHDQTYRKSRWRDAVVVPESYGAAGVPIVAHLAAVAMTVARAGWDEAVVAAAFLHDVLEDRNRFGDHMAEETLIALVGEEVTHYVIGVTEPQFDDLGKPLPWRTRKDTYLDTLAEASDESVAISLADKMHNAWSMVRSLEAGVDIFTRGENRRPLSAGPVEQSWFYRQVIDLSTERKDARLDGLRAQLVAEVGRFEELTLSRQ
jgi:(p)ppGpp synthase/HD superfamily hydrolase